MEGVVQLDQQLSLWLNQHNPLCLNGFWHVMSGVRDWIPLYVLLIVLVVWRLGWKKGLALVGAAILGLVLTDQIANLFKDGFMRLRPCRDPWMIAQGVLCPDGIIGGLYGFFSGHAANTFCFATLCWMGLKKGDPAHRYGWLGVFLYFWAALMAVSRVMLAAHYLGDILAGCLFGLLMGFLLSFGLDRLVFRASR